MSLHEGNWRPLDAGPICNDHLFTVKILFSIFGLATGFPHPESQGAQIERPRLAS